MSPSCDSSVIILAGGKSERMGVPKGLMDWGGEPWLMVQLKALAACGLGRATIVLGYGSDEYFKALSFLKKALDESIEAEGVVVKTVINPNPWHGPFSSLQTAARSLLEEDKSLKGAYICPVDVPIPDKTVWEALAEAMSSGDKLFAAVPEFAGAGGHPVLVSRDFLEGILLIAADSKDARLDVQLKALPQGWLRKVAVTDPRIRLNINTPEDKASLN
jgi:CTP:molybdopterin cytidylyltransferase MocA